MAVGVTLLLLAGCGSQSVSAQGASSAQVPASAFSDFTGITSHSVTVANVSTQTAGLFKGALVGAEAYADYVNAHGGINGRRIVVKGSDDGFSGALNKQQTQAAVESAFASVGSFSLEDSFGGKVLAANPQMPNVSEVLDPSNAKLPNTFSPEPSSNGWPLGPLTYFKQRFPQDIRHVGTIVAALPSTEIAWAQEKMAMDHLGYKVVYQPALPASTTDFTPSVIAMKQAGVKILFLEQSPENYASATIQALDQQNFHPVVVLGAPSYNESLVKDSGGARAIDGTYLWQAAALYLGEDAKTIPDVATFNYWVQAASPGFNADYFALYGWLSAELFAQALAHAGAKPSRGSLLVALRQIKHFTGGGLIPPSNPAQKIPVSCYLVARIMDGRFTRLDDPNVGGPTHGFRCDQPYFHPAS